MFPELFTLGRFTIHSYGVMLGCGFLVASYVFTLELRRRSLDPRLAGTITVLAFGGGVGGAKLFFLLENWEAFLAAPLRMALAPSGLTFYGGFLVATAAIAWYLRKQRVPFPHIADAAAPGLLLGYGITRLGCHLAGDGDYGIPTTLPWGTIYANGTSKPSLALADYFSRNPEAATQWRYHELVPQVTGRDHFGPITRFDLTATLHPTPVYEFLLCALLFAMLWRLRTKIHPPGRMFMLYLICAGTERLAVEFIRLNPRIWGLSQAQWIALILTAVGAVGWWLPFGTGRDRLSERSARRRGE